MNEQLLTAIFSDDIKDEIIDTLMALQGLSGFSLGQIDGYSRQHSEYDLKEQVAGYRRMWRAEILHRQEQERELLLALEGTSKASHLRYWVMPLTVSGSFG